MATLLQADPDATTRLVYWLILLVLLGFVGIAMVVALMSSWRNYHRRQRLLAKGRRLRMAFRGESASAPLSDVWREAGRRYSESEPAEGEEGDEGSSGDDPPSLR